jgi:hypothetical protein
LASTRRDLRATLKEETLRTMAAVYVEREPEATVRVKVGQGFSTEWRGIPFDAPAGSIIDLPRGFVRATRGLFEVLDDQETPLHRVQPSVPR